MAVNGVKGMQFSFGEYTSFVEEIMARIIVIHIYYILITSLTIPNNTHALVQFPAMLFMWSSIKLYSYNYIIHEFCIYMVPPFSF